MEQRGEYRWIVKETDGRWWLVAEPCGARIKIIGPDGRDLQIALNLRPDMSRDRAHQLAEMLNARVATVELF